MINTLLAGDVWLAPSLRNKSHEINASLKRIVENISYDIFICNLEAPIKSEQIRPHRRALLYTDRSLLDSVKIADKNVLILANNHMNDFGNKGLLRTIDVCRERGFLVVGAGANLVDARKPLVIEVEEHKIAIMAYADTAPHVGAISATKNKPGIAPLDIDMIIEDINNIRCQANDIWIFLHWGREFIRYPMPMQKQMSSRLFESGADMIIGHHPHVIIGCEKIGQADVYYSLGNFIFPDILLQDQSIFKWDKISRSSIILKASFEHGCWSIHRDHIFLNLYGLPEPSEDTRAAKKFENLSRLISDECYSKRYRWCYLFERTRNIATRSVGIKKMFKDIRWRFHKENH